ncbi:amino acid adenylation domain-containing protein [Flavobacterium sp. FlaQc-51]|uniref:amino acid adenylation domain-containing protein n=1 Tax=Flavobacterium sp. FlaQc-51 TaxID=3374184 RepID=UPI0037567854
MQALLRKLNELNIKIDLVDEKLDIQAPKGVMSSDLLEEIKLHKNSLVAFIKLHKAKNEAYVFIPQVQLQDSYILSSSQSRLWLLSQFEDGNAAYNMPGVFELKGKIDIFSLQNAFNQLIARHESLRTVFKRDQTGEVRQFILQADAHKFKLQFEDISTKKDVFGRLENTIREESEYAFNLSEDSLLRAKLVQISEDTYLFIFVMHHIISDGHSAEIMTNELFALYDSISQKYQNQLPALSLQYKDYAAWQQAILKNDGLAIHKSYWIKQFEGDLPILDLPSFQSRPVIKTYNGKSVSRILNDTLSKNFNTLCQSESATLFMGLLAVVKIIFFKYTNQTDIVVGSPIKGRENSDLQNQIGFYINTLALRTQFDEKDSFENLLKNIKKVTLDGYEHQIYPFDELVENLSIKRDVGRNPLFDVMVTLNDRKNTKEKLQSINGLSIQEYKIEESAFSKFDLSFTFNERNDGLELILTYNTDIYADEFCSRILDHFQVLLFSITAAPNAAINTLNYLTALEKKQLITGFNTSKTDYPKDKTLIDLFEAQAENKPKNIAIAFEDTKLSYAELHQKANNLTHYLKAQGAEANSNIILCFDSHLEMAIIGLLAILKLGAVYVPVDPDFPLERIQYIIQDSNAKFIITNSIDNPLNEDSTVRSILLDKEGLDYNPESVKNNTVQSSNAYLIYTSGSTGSPKGVVVNHQNIIDYLFGLSEKIRIEDNKSFAIMSTIATDLGNTVLFSSLVFGGTIHLFSKNTLRDIIHIQQYFSANEIDCIKIVPSYWKSLQINCEEMSPKKMIVFGGEELTIDIVRKINSENPKLKIINHYGPTETTIGKLIHEVDPNYNYSRIPIGKAFSNTQTYVVDSNLNLCATGIKGELLIGGDGVSNGYWNNTVLSQEKFITDTFLNNGGKLYKTGDLVILQKDGTIEFKGRIDHQVKILGHRIELSEIEKILNKFKSVKSSIATVWQTENERKRIAAYVVYEKEELPHNEIMTHLRQFLPSYMIPSVLVKIDEVPFTSNGKINYKILPEITKDHIVQNEYKEPATDTERKLQAIWQEVLVHDRISITDNFFELGGHSLLVAQVINSANKVIGKNISFKNFFSNPTIEELALIIEQDSVDVMDQIAVTTNKFIEGEACLLSNNQKRLWIVNQNNQISNAYNVTTGLLFEGNFDVVCFIEAYKNIIQRHESFRTQFIFNENEPVQYVLENVNANVEIERYDFLLSEDELVEKINFENKFIFDIRSAPLSKLKIIKMQDNNHFVIISMHHLISDGWSMDLLIEEWIETYSALIENRTPYLPEQHFTYRDFSIWQHKYLESTKYKETVSYWKNRLNKEISYLYLSKNNADEKNPVNDEAGLVSFQIDNFVYQGLREIAGEYKVSMFSLLLTGFSVLLYHVTNQNDIILGTSTAGRTRKEFESIIGFFINTLPIRITIESTDRFIDLLLKSNQGILQDIDNQDISLDEIIKNSNTSNKGSDALFQGRFVFNEDSRSSINAVERLKIDKIERIEVTELDAKFNFSLIITAAHNSISGSFEYKKQLYDKDYIELLIDNYNVLLRKIITDYKQEVSSLNLFTDSYSKYLKNKNKNNTNKVFENFMNFSKK